MGAELTIVVTCTDRKSLPVNAALKLRDLPDIGFAARVTEWRGRLRSASRQVPLRDLYMGDAWSRVENVTHAAARAGFTPKVVVASAGLGLRHPMERAPGYSATFAPRHPDTVPGDVSSLRSWWRELNVDSDARDEIRAGVGPVMMILSRRYADVLAEDIREIEDSRELLVVGGSDSVDADRRLPSDRGLRGALGGTLTSLNVRMAAAWLACIEDGALASGTTRQAWADWSQANWQDESHDRQPLGDKAIAECIVELQAGDPGMTRSRALRELRSRGFACEQRRFSNIYLATTGATE